MTLFECYGCLQADILRRRADGDDEVALFHHAAALRVDKRQRFVSERKAYLPLFARCEPDAPEAAELSGRAYRRGDHVRDVELVRLRRLRVEVLRMRQLTSRTLSPLCRASRLPYSNVE